MRMKVIKAGYLIESSDKVYKDYGLVYTDDTIIDILPNKLIDDKYKDAEVIDAGNKILMPGFINAHMHQYGIMSRGIPANVEFKDFEGFLNDYWWPFIENRISLKEVIATTKASAVELLESGVIGYCDTLEAPNIESGSLIEQARIVEELGMKAILSLESCERISIENGYKCIDENINLINWCKDNSSLVQGMICTHTSFTCSNNFLIKAKKAAKEHNAMWQFHLSESIYEPNICKAKHGIKPVKYYESLNLLSDKVLASQCVQIDEEEIGILKKYNTKVVHMPLSNCEVGGGIAPVPEMLQKGIHVALGTDGYINDFFAVMKTAFLIHKGYKEDATVMPANMVFKMATENGANVLGWNDTGKLKVGFKSDFIILDNEFMTPITEGNIFDQIIVYGQKEYVNSVYINGKCIMKNHNLLNVDKFKIKEDVKVVTADFWDGIGTK